MKTYERLIRNICQFLASIGAVCLFIIVFAITLDVGGRLLFNRPIYGTMGTVRTLLVFLIFFSLPLAQVRKTHLRVEFVLNKMNRDKRELLLAFGLIFDFIIIAILTYGCFNIAHKSFLMREKLSGIINYPVWPGRYAVAIGMLFLSLQYSVDIFNHYKTYQQGKKLNEF